MNTPTLTIAKNEDGTFTGTVTNGNSTTITKYDSAADLRTKLLSPKQQQALRESEMQAQQQASSQQRIDKLNADIAIISAALNQA
jgi:hypothetical protein